MPIRCLLLTALLALSAAGAHAEEALRVLFIGNSLTYTNDLPAMLASLAKDAGRPEPIHASQTPGGCTWRKHWEDGAALAKLRSRTWDWVVLQEMSAGALAAPQDMADFGARFAREIAAGGAKTAWYLTWARADRQATQPAITKAYTDLQAANGGTLVPVGLAWDAYRTAHPDESLFADERHPNRAGTYLAACVFYGTLYRASPVGLGCAPAGVEPARARRLQEAAWAAVTGSRHADGAAAR